MNQGAGAKLESFGCLSFLLIPSGNLYDGQLVINCFLFVLKKICSRNNPDNCTSRNIVLFYMLNLSDKNNGYLSGDCIHTVRAKHLSEELAPPPHPRSVSGVPPVCSQTPGDPPWPPCPHPCPSGTLDPVGRGEGGQPPPRGLSDPMAFRMIEIVQIYCVCEEDNIMCIVWGGIFFVQTIDR